MAQVTSKVIDGLYTGNMGFNRTKSIDKDLGKKVLQSNGTIRTSFEQACNYTQWMIPSEMSLWIVTCNFKSFKIHDMNKPNELPLVVLLEEEHNKLSLFDFIFKADVSEFFMR